MLMRGRMSDGGSWRRRLMIEGLKGRSRSLLPLLLCCWRSWCMVGRGGDRLDPGLRRRMVVERRRRRRLIGLVPR